MRKLKWISIKQWTWNGRVCTVRSAHHHRSTTTTLIVPYPFQETQQTRGTWESFRVLATRCGNEPSSIRILHTHIYTFISALSIKFRVSCCVCPVYSSVQFLSLSIYILQPDPLTFFRPTSLYSSDSIQHLPFLLTFFLGFCIFLTWQTTVELFYQRKILPPCRNL